VLGGQVEIQLPCEPIGHPAGEGDGDSREDAARVEPEEHVRRYECWMMQPPLPQLAACPQQLRGMDVVENAVQLVDDPDVPGPRRHTQPANTPRPVADLFRSRRHRAVLTPRPSPSKYVNSWSVACTSRCSTVPLGLVIRSSIPGGSHPAAGCSSWKVATTSSASCTSRPSARSRIFASSTRCLWSARTS